MITALFKNVDYITVPGLTQYDFGQILRIEGLSLPNVVEVHFSVSERGGTSLICVGAVSNNVTEVKIPNRLLVNNGIASDYDIYAWIYIRGEEAGESIKRIKMPVKSRPRPEDFEELEDEEMFTEVINQVNAAADRAEAAASRVEGSVDSVTTQAVEAVTEAKTAGVSAVNTAGSTQISAVNEAGAEQVRQLQVAKEERLTELENEITTAGNNEINRIGEAATQKKSEIDQHVTEKLEAANADFVQAVNTAKAAINEHTQTKQTEAGNAIDQAKTSAVDEVNTAGTTQVGAVNAAGAAKIQEIQNMETQLYEEYIKSMRDELDVLSRPQVEAPEPVASVEEMTDSTKMYILEETKMIYHYGSYEEIVEPTEFYDKSQVLLNKRYSGTPGTMVSTNSFVILPEVPVSPPEDGVQKVAVSKSGANGYNSIDKVAYLDSDGNVLGCVVVGDSPDYGKTEVVDDARIYHIGYLNSGAKVTYYDNIAYFQLVLKVFSDTTIVTEDKIPDLSIKYYGASASVETKTGWHSTGMTYTPTDYDDRITSAETQTLKNASDIEQLKQMANDDISQYETYPSVWDAPLAECIAKIKALQIGRNCITFPFFSDNHQRNGYAGALIAKVMRECHMPYCFYGGDSISSGYIASEAEMIEQDRKFDSMMKSIPNGRFCRAAGNHDGFWAVSADESHTYTREQIYELFFREESISQSKKFGEDGTYYYVDDIASKTRFVVCNSNGGFGETQRGWVQNTALQFGEPGWAVAFFSHAPVTNNFHANIPDAQDMQAVLTTYINGNSANKADIAGWFSGHIHRDRIYQCDHTANVNADDQETVDLPWKTVTITSDHTSIAYDDATKHTVADDALSHAIDFITINKNTRTVHITRLGIGNDRSYTY